MYLKKDVKGLAAYENSRHFIIGPSNVSKTYYRLRKLEKIESKKPNHIIARSANQYSNYKRVLILNQ